MERYWEAIRTIVCKKCVDGDGRGHCRLPREETCAVREFHPEVYSLITTMQNDSYDDYVKALRRRICSMCGHQSTDGICTKRQSLECALDRYYPLIIEVAENLLVNAPSSALGGGVVS